MFSMYVVKYVNKLCLDQMRERDPNIANCSVLLGSDLKKPGLDIFF